MKKLSDARIIILDDTGYWYRKKIHNLLAWGDWGVHQTLENKEFSVYHLPTGFCIKNVREKKYAKQLAKRLHQNIKMEWKEGKDSIEDFINFYVELIYKLDGLDLSISLLSMHSRFGLDPNIDIPF